MASKSTGSMETNERLRDGARSLECNSAVARVVPCPAFVCG